MVSEVTSIQNCLGRIWVVYFGVFKRMGEVRSFFRGISQLEKKKEKRRGKEKKEEEKEKREKGTA
jgi:hypothetical protein